ncbi:MAG TPA: beta-N-acetylhexosaminidase [Stellaceae bacterium]|nr:beta-N-acetylhexosaminidase [Stellaceae bacterium]
MAKPVIFGCEGAVLSASERAFFRDADPLGFILFARNCETPDQVKRLVADLRESVGRGTAPILIDQEGGRVARLKPPHWPAYPAPAAIAALGGLRAREAAWLAARLIADDLGQLGITVDCAPVLDVPVGGADPVIGDRAWGDHPQTVAENGLAACDGLMAGGVLPVIKHIPGHGRATVDSHRALPVVKTPRAELDSTDFAPFRALASMPWAMTAHVLYTAIDPDQPATLSPRVIADVIRAGIGFDGVLLSDDLSMAALGGKIEARALDALRAGCDLVLHCNGILDEMQAIAAAIGPMTGDAQRRVATGEERRAAPRGFDRFAAERRLAALLAQRP